MAHRRRTGAVMRDAPTPRRVPTTWKVRAASCRSEDPSPRCCDTPSPEVSGLPCCSATGPAPDDRPRRSQRLSWRTRVNAEQPGAIRAVCPFRLVVDEDMGQLNREITMSAAPTGTTLFEEGDAADGVAAILEGSIEVLKKKEVGSSLRSAPGPSSASSRCSCRPPLARLPPERTRRCE